MFLQQLVKIARNVRRVAVKDWCIAHSYLPRVRHDDDLRCEVLAPSRRLVLRVRRDVPTPDVLDGDVSDVEPDVVTRLRLRERLVVSLNRLHSDSTPHGANRIIDRASGRPSQHAQQGRSQSQRSF